MRVTAQETVVKKDLVSWNSHTFTQFIRNLPSFVCSVGSSNSHSQQGHSPNFRDSVESYYAPDPQPQHQQQQSLPSDYAAFRNSLYGGMANENHGPAVPPKGATDQRLNPDLLGGQGDDRGGEAASLADDADYSRVLRYVRASFYRCLSTR